MSKSILLLILFRSPRLRVRGLLLDGFPFLIHSFQSPVGLFSKHPKIERAVKMAHHTIPCTSSSCRGLDSLNLSATLHSFSNSPLTSCFCSFVPESIHSAYSGYNATHFGVTSMVPINFPFVGLFSFISITWHY